MSDTPTQAVVAAANVTRTVTDANGRKISYRKLKPIDRMRVAMIAGESSTNPGFLMWAMTAYGVTAIDDVPMPRATDLRALEAAVTKLDDTGFDALFADLAAPATEA